MAERSAVDGTNITRNLSFCSSTIDNYKSIIENWNTTSDGGGGG